MLDIKQQQHERVRPRGTEGSCIGYVSGDLHGLELEDRIERHDTDGKDNEDEHGPCHALIYVLKQGIKYHGCDDEKDLIQQVSDNGHANKPGVRDDICGCGGCITGNIQPGICKSYGKASKDADEQVEDACDSGEALR